MNNKHVNLHCVSYKCNGVRILKDISLQLKEARIGVIGANGSGKSTFARLICGLIRPQKGIIHAYGIDVFADRKSAVKTVGLIFQNPDHQIIFPTCLEEITFGLIQGGATKKQATQHAHHILKKFNRANWANRSTQSLSQGQRHLLCLITILAMSPVFLVFDEPYAGLDLATSTWLHRYLTQLKQQIILISHDINVLQTFDRIIWLDNGRIFMDGGADLILNTYKIEMKNRAKKYDLL